MFEGHALHPLDRGGVSGTINMAMAVQIFEANNVGVAFCGSGMCSLSMCSVQHEIITGLAAVMFCKGDRLSGSYSTGRCSTSYWPVSCPESPDQPGPDFKFPKCFFGQKTVI